jgi:hypothetical protein
MKAGVGIIDPAASMLLPPGAKLIADLRMPSPL